MILVAHADDETLGAGGVIQKLIRDKWEISVVILSDGKLTVRGVLEDNSGDANKACQVLGVGDPVFLGYADQKFDTFPIADMANSVFSLNINPDLIISHVDTDLNQDHRIVCEIAKIIGRPKAKPVAILGCEIPNTSFWNGAPFQPNYYVNITDELETKIEAFSQYENELQKYPHPWSKKGLKLLAEYHGMQSGQGFSEAFQVIRGFNGLMP